jgi:hypothetical protein
VRDLRELDKYRVRSPHVLKHYGSYGDETCGVFDIPLASRKLRVIASSDAGWDHISVSLANRCPNWGEMDRIKHMFFTVLETAMQLHVPPHEHINVHPYTLHLWAPHNEKIPRPPSWMVA